MRRAFGAIAGAAFLSAGLAAQPPVKPADPAPPPAKLPDPVGDPAAERLRLRGQLDELLLQMKRRAIAAEPAAKAPAGKFDLPASSQPVDLLRAATNLFRNNDTDAALGALRQIDPKLLGPQDGALATYLTACCLRKLNRRPEAAVLFREVAEGKDDEFLAGCAISQLALIRTSQEIEGLLAQLRTRPKSP